jgi:hypothetical protein
MHFATGKPGNGNAAGRMEWLHGKSDKSKKNQQRPELSDSKQVGRAGEWRRVADTSLASPDDIAEPGKGTSMRKLRG